MKQFLKLIVFPTVKLSFYFWICYQIFIWTLTQMFQNGFPEKSGYLIVTILYGYVIWAICVWNVEMMMPVFKALDKSQEK